MSAAHLKGPPIPPIFTTGPYRCVGKVALRSAKIAQDVLHRMPRNGREDDLQPRSVYRCPDCGLWHLGRAGQDKNMGQQAGRRRADLVRKEVKGDE